jgi:hypothetical protein
MSRWQHRNQRIHGEHFGRQLPVTRRFKRPGERHVDRPFEKRLCPTTSVPFQGVFPCREHRQRTENDGAHLTVFVRFGSNAGCPYRKLTAGLGNDTAASWSHDGKWIYFGSEREAGAQIWRVPASGGPANRLTKTDGVAALESVDGKTLYFSKVSDPGLWSLPLAGGTESKVLPSLYGVDNFAVAKRGVYIVRAAPESQGIISFRDFSSGAIEGLAVLKVPVGRGMAVSPDERSILYTQLDRADSDLFLVDNFR